MDKDREIDRQTDWEMDRYRRMDRDKIDERTNKLTTGRQTWMEGWMMDGWMQ
jgi:hypothetical protein